jgi:hypothetical protein
VIVRLIKHKKDDQLRHLQKNMIYGCYNNTTVLDCILCYTDKLRNTAAKCMECKGKAKAIPFQALTGPEGSRRLRLSDF